MFIIDENDTMLAHAADPALVNRPASEAVGPNGYPAGEGVVAVADDDGAWFEYTYPNPDTAAAETKHSWIVRHDGLVFGSGWYESGPRKSDAPAYTQSFVRQALNLYDALGLDAAIEYYSSTESVDGQWYVFIVDEDGYTIGHHNPAFLGRDPSLRVDLHGVFLRRRPAGRNGDRPLGRLRAAEPGNGRRTAEAHLGRAPRRPDIRVRLVRVAGNLGIGAAPRIWGRAGTLVPDFGRRGYCSLAVCSRCQS